LFEGEMMSDGKENGSDPASCGMNKTACVGVTPMAHALKGMALQRQSHPTTPLSSRRSTTEDCLVMTLDGEDEPVISPKVIPYSYEHELEFILIFRRN
jgi:hypothetical protein